MEGSATWVEDVVYDGINDNYQYLTSSPIRHPRTSLDYGGGLFPYGSFIFFSFAAERHSNTVVRRFWDGAVGATTGHDGHPHGARPARWASFFTLFGSWNTLPAHSYSERAGYPSPTWWHRKTLQATHASTGVCRGCASPTSPALPCSWSPAAASAATGTCSWSSTPRRRHSAPRSCCSGATATVGSPTPRSRSTPPATAAAGAVQPPPAELGGGGPRKRPDSGASPTVHGEGDRSLAVAQLPRRNKTGTSAL